MRTSRSAFLLCSLLFAACTARADLYGGTRAGTVAAGGSLAYDASSADGADLSFELHGGFYAGESFLVGGSLSVQDDDVASTYEAAALCQYHWLALFGDGNDSPYGFSPYVGARLGLAHGKDAADKNTGALAGLRIGIDVFFTENVVLDLAFDLDACTGAVYPDDGKLRKSDATLRLGLDFHF